MSKISALVNGHGYFDAMPEAVDRAIAEYLPASPAGLQEIAEQRSGLSFQRLAVAESLVILASLY